MSFEPLPAAKRAADQSERFRAAADQIRQRTDTTVKALGTVGTAAVAAIGYAELADVFPWAGPGWAILLIVLGPVAMIAAVVLLIHRFEDVSKTIATSSDKQRTKELNGLGEEDQAEVAKVYEQAAILNEVPSLQAYEARAHRFERIADSLNPATDSARREELRAQADLIHAEVLATQNRAAAFVLRRRAKNALFSRETIAWLALFVAGWYLTALAADVIESRRSGEIALAKSCAEVRGLEKAVESEIPEEACGKAPAKEEPEETSIQADVADAVTKLAEARSACLKKAEKDGEDPSACARLDRAIVAALAESAP